jgi:hypothetical protein
VPVALAAAADPAGLAAALWARRMGPFGHGCGKPWPNNAWLGHLIAGSSLYRCWLNYDKAIVYRRVCKF